MSFVGNSMPYYSLSFACKNCLRCLVKDLLEIVFIYHPKKILHLPLPLRRQLIILNLILINSFLLFPP